MKVMHIGVLPPKGGLRVGTPTLESWVNQAGELLSGLDGITYFEEVVLGVRD